MNTTLENTIKYRAEQIKASVESLVYEKDGRKYIAIGNHALDFKKEYLYLGMTKSGLLKLGNFVICGPNEQIRIKYGKIENGKIYVEGARFIEKLPVVSL